MSYNLAPFHFASFQDTIMLTNDAGRFIFMPQESFSAFVQGCLNSSDAYYDMLNNHGFLISQSKQSFVDYWASEIRYNKSCHFQATQLFILVLTTACNQQCLYCQASAGKNAFHMTLDTAIHAIDIAFESPASYITIEFQGGEPSLNDGVLRDAIVYARKKEKESNKEVSLTLVTNFTSANEEQLDWLMSKQVSICTSLDGPPALHNRNRPLLSKKDSYNCFEKGAQIFLDLCTKHNMPPIIQAIQTTTRFPLSLGREIVDEYRKWNIESIYLRPLTPLGLASTNWNHIGYTPTEYIMFYIDVIEYMLSLEKRGIPIRETTASMYLRRILKNEALHHSEFRSPCGGAVGQMAIDYNGKIYTCDEARMLASLGDDSFLLGTVNNTYRELIKSPVAHALCTASCIEALPMCSDCVYQPYCATCPVVTYGIDKTLFSSETEGYRCAIAKGILSFFFSLIKKNDEEEMEILYRWAEF